MDNSNLNIPMLINNVADEIKGVLMERSRKFGDGTLEPSNIFSKLDGMEHINVRIDDKIAKIGNEPEGEDKAKDETDLIGLLILKQVARRIREGQLF